MQMHIKIKIVAALALAVFVLPGVSLAQTQHVADLQAEIQSLMAQLQTLQSQLAAAGGGSTATTWCYTFDNNLSIGMSGSAVTSLQTALQKDGESVTVSGTFDDQTAAAVTGFQEKYQSAILSPYGLTNGTGYAGKSTRAELNSLFGCGTIPVQPVGPAPVQPTPVNPSPAMSVYQNSQYGVRFSYPSNYTVKYGNAAFGTSNNPLGDDGIGMENSNFTSLITIEMPSNSYPDTGFDGAYLNVSVGTQMTSSQCSAMNTAGSSPSNGTKTIGGVPFNWSVDGSAAAGTDFTNGSFSGYINGTCYVLLAGGVEGNGAIGNVGSDGVTITAVNQNSILAVLNSVLATMTFSAVNPPIVCPAWGCGYLPIATGTAWALPSINPLNPSSGPLGTMITITGSGFKNGNAFTGDSDSVVWISNGSQKGVLASYQPQTDSTMTVGTPYSVCQTNNAYSGAPCSSSMTLAPGNYSIYVVNGNGTSNSEPFTVISAPTTTNNSISISPTSGPAGTTIALTGSFSVCGSSISPVDCSTNRFNQYVLLQNGVAVGGALNFVGFAMGGMAEVQIPTSIAAGVYQFAVQNCLGITCSNYPQAIFTVTGMSSASAGILTISPSKISGMDSAPVFPGEGGVDLLNVDLTAGASSNVTVNMVNVSCGGMDCSKATTNVRLEEIAVNGQGISAQTWMGSSSNFQLFTPNLVIPAGTTVTLALYADIPSNAPVGQQMVWSLTPGGGLVTITPAGSITGSAQGNVINIAAATVTNLPAFSLSPSSGPVGTITTLSSTNSQCGALNQCTYVWLQNGSTVATNAQWTSPNQIQVPASCAPGICDLGIWNPTKTLESEVPFTVTAGGTSSNGTILSVSANSAFPSGSTIAGSQSQKIASYVVTAPSSESVTLSQVGLTFQGSSAAYVGGVDVAYNPTLAASTNGSNGTYTLVNTGGQIYQTNLPSQLNVTIPAGGSLTLDFYAVNVNNVPAGSQIGTSLTCAAQGNISNAIYSCGANQGQEITVATVSNSTASNLQMKADPSFPGGHVAVAGTVYLGTFDLTATGGESVKIISLPTNYFIQGSNVTGGEISNLELVNGNAQQIGSTIPSLTSGNTNGSAGNGIYDATFGNQNNPLNLIVPGNSTVKVSILGTLAASAAGDSIQAGVNGGSLNNAVGTIYNLNIPIGDVGAPTTYPTTAQ